VRSRLAVQIATIAATLAALPAPASAQGVFDWFNQRRDDRYQQQNSWSGQRQEWNGGQQRHYTPQVSAYSDPTVPMQAPRYGAPGTPSIGGGGGRSVAYCVRLCDGRHFPMQRHSNATSIQLCNAFCPAAKTQVFNGAQIDHAVASNGARYANLENAFVYREKIVSGCTCNGKDAFGLAKIDVANDPTLKPGDIVATGDNQKAALIANAAKMAKLADQQERLKAKQAAAKAVVTGVTDAPAVVTDEDKPED
jgi:Protein of unknown function (DUF2865)